MYDSLSLSVQQNGITKKIFKVFTNSTGDLFISLHYFKSEQYHCGTAYYPPGIDTIQLNPIIEGKKASIPVKFSYHQDGQVHFKAINPKQIKVEIFHKFAEVKCTPFHEIKAQHIFTIEFELIERFKDFKLKDKKEIYRVFKAPDDAIRFKFLGYLGKSEKDVLNLNKDAKTFTIHRKTTPTTLCLGLDFIPFKEGLDPASPHRSIFYFMAGFRPEFLKHKNSGSFLYLYAK